MVLLEGIKLLWIQSRYRAVWPELVNVASPLGELGLGDAANRAVQLLKYCSELCTRCCVYLCAAMLCSLAILLHASHALFKSPSSEG